MSAYDLHDLLVERGGLIANTWQFFVSVHFALLGIAFVVRRQLPMLILRTVMLIGYAGFMYVNYMAQLDNYRYGAALSAYAATLASTETNPQLKALHELAAQNGWILKYLVYIYAASTVIGALAIFLPAFRRTHVGEHEEETPPAF
jgi:hypothetical protein